MLHVAGISMATILQGLYQIFKWIFYNICKLLGIQTLSTCFQKLKICVHVMIFWCHLNSISKFETIFLSYEFWQSKLNWGAFNWQSIYLWNYRDLSGNALSGQIADIFNSIFGGQNRKKLSLQILDLSSNHLNGIMPKMPLATSHLTQL